ncbi:hypothetical protein [Yersinia enterocolitica]|uniref:hypothetical protein n=1 Tax=Yersinia enterocolitica TaxID=630 RepID=UPI00313DFF69
MNSNLSDKTAASVRNGVLGTAGVGSILMGLTRFLDGTQQEVVTLLVPIISSLISFIYMQLYCRFIEPHEVVQLRAGLKRDMKEQKSIIKDKYADEKTRANATEIYSATRMKIATLRQDYNSGKTRIVSPSITEKIDT